MTSFFHMLRIDLFVQNYADTALWTACSAETVSMTSQFPLRNTSRESQTGAAHRSHLPAAYGLCYRTGPDAQETLVTVIEDMDARYHPSAMSFNPHLVQGKRHHDEQTGQRMIMSDAFSYHLSERERELTSDEVSTVMLAMLSVTISLAAVGWFHRALTPEAIAIDAVGRPMLDYPGALSNTGFDENRLWSALHELLTALCSGSLRLVRVRARWTGLLTRLQQGADFFTVEHEVMSTAQLAPIGREVQDATPRDNHDVVSTGERPIQLIVSARSGLVVIDDLLEDLQTSLLKMRKNWSVQGLLTRGMQPVNYAVAVSIILTATALLLL